MRNWKRLKPEELAHDYEKWRELAESDMAIIHCEAKGDRLPPTYETSGHFLANCDGILMFKGHKELWTLNEMCERYRVWYYIVPAFDGIR